MQSSCKLAQLSERSLLLDFSRKRTDSLNSQASFPLTPKFLGESSRASVRNTEFGFSIAKPTSLLVLNLQESKFHLSQAAENYLQSLQGECYVISVSGNPLVGKSSLLNLLLSFFERDASQEKVRYQDLYPIGDGKRSTTEGIDMYCLSIENKNFIFLDVEGDNDPGRGKAGTWIYTNLIQTAVSVSHVHLYNYNGLAQESFLTYFKSISQIVKQNHIHDEFETKYAFLKRNHRGESKSELTEDLEDLKSYFDERLCGGGIDHSLYLLPTAPPHIIERKSKTSCIISPGFLCEDCQGHLFTSILLGIYNELNVNLGKLTPFRNGSHVASALEEMVAINKMELPFFLDEGNISKIRSNTFKRELIRIQAGLLEVEQLQDSNKLYKEIQKIINDHPNLADPKLYERFSATQTSLTTRISQMAYLIPELSKFVEQYLLDDKASILDKGEKQSLWEIYVAHFDKLTWQIITSLKDYDAMIQSICQNLLDIKVDTQANLQEYMAIASDSLRKTIAVVINLGASGVVGLVGKEVATKVVAGVVVGGGFAGAALTAYFFMRAYKKLKKAKVKHEAALNSKKINGINNLQDAKEEMKKIEEFVTQLVDDLERNRETLKNVCLEEEENGNFRLIDTINEVMDNKINGIQLSSENRAKLIVGMRVAESNLQRFKNCL